MRASHVAFGSAFATFLGCALLTNLGDLGAPNDGGDESSPDAGPDSAADANPDSTADAARPCDPTTPFTPVGAVLGLAANDEDEQIVRLTPNELEAYVFETYIGDGGAGLSGIVHFDRQSTAQPFANRVPVGVTQHAPFGITADGLELVVASGAAFDWSRKTTASGFTGGASISFGGVAGLYLQQPYVMPNGGALYGSSRNIDDAGGVTYYPVRSARSDAGWGPLTSLGLAMNATIVTLYPVVSEDELVVYFAQFVASSTQIFVATRAANTSPFGAPKAVSELNVTTFQRPTWISSDLCRLYYVVGTPADVHMASRLPL